MIACGPEERVGLVCTMEEQRARADIIIIMLEQVCHSVSCTTTSYNVRTAHH